MYGADIEDSDPEDQVGEQKDRKKAEVPFRQKGL